MVLMAIDHVRVYSGVPAGGQTPGVFFTRWVTHFCAPAFVFLAGTAAYLHGRKLGDMRALSRFLVTRGLILVVLELTLIRFAWTFNVAYNVWILAGVIWMLGWSMVLLAALVRLRPRTVGIIGVLMMLFQQVFGMLPRALPASARAAIGPVYEFFYPAGLDGWAAINILYVIIPWVGVMAAGYWFGTVMERPEEERHRFCLRLGLAMTAAFVVLGTLVTVMQPAPDGPPALFRVLNQGKYPPTQLFLVMTLGPLIALLPAAERATGRIGEFFAVFGRVPLFYYLLHIPLIHASALVVGLIRDGAMHQEWYASAPYTQMPETYRWSLGLLYLVFVIDVAILYWPSRWFARRKAERKAGWMQYI
jgi:uncharacterized membrane protein